MQFNISFLDGYLCVQTMMKSLEKKRISLATLHAKLDASIHRLPQEVMAMEGEESKE